MTKALYDHLMTFSFLGRSKVTLVFLYAYSLTDLQYFDTLMKLFNYTIGGLGG